ncbi:MAG: lamin tail domain-containing protein, partial [Anaerolineae bacterium]|nr:lamin tail domain-containing protein [Anaerolineae bacterium]
AWDLSGMYLTDVLSEPTKWPIPAGTVLPPDGALIIWADGEVDEGPYHANFTLSAAGGQLGLFDRDVFGNAPISVLTYTPPVTDVSYGRLPDGSERWQFFTTPSPGRPNLGLPPRFGRTFHSPTWPVANKPVTITTTITDEGRFTVTLWYRAFAPGQLRPGYTPRTMTGVGATRQAVLPSLQQGTWVEYYLRAVDETGKVSLDRPGWPQGDYRYIVGWQPLPLYINEVMALNSRTLADEQGDYDDWIELYNAGPTPLDVGGMYLTDDLDDATVYMIPYGTVIPAGGYLIVWADGRGTGLHTNFNLSGAGEYVGLFDRQSRFYAPVDAVYYDPLTSDVSWGRVPDGAPRQYVLAVPSPGGPNRLPPPTFSQVTRTPRWPGEGDEVTITALITSGTPLVSVTLWYAVGNDTYSVAMQRSGEDTYGAIIPPLADRVVVRYYLRAEDEAGRYSLYPPDAPTSTIRYIVGYTLPQVLINEFLAYNTAVNRDEAGEYDDWVELYNAGPITVSLGGMYLSDSLADPTKWQFPPGTVIPPGGHLLVWCDRDTDQGPLHTTFKLERNGEEIGLFERTPYGLVLPVDWMAFGPQRKNISYGRWPDGAEAWRAFTFPTPGAGNQ